MANQALQYNLDNELCLYGQSLKNRGSSPAYVYSKAGLNERVLAFLSQLKALTQTVGVHYAMKANSHPELLKILKAQALGVDVVSGGELKIALENGFSPEKIIFSGVGKTKAEIEFALKTKIKQLNVESLPELERIGSLGIQAAVVFRLNPNVDAKTHPYISTGFKENKFGIDESQIPEFLACLKKYPTLELKGISSHIGSQIADLAVISEAIKKMRKLFDSIQEAGFKLSVFDVGGGVGIDYAKDASSDLERIANYGKILSEDLKGLNAEIQMEPGRILVARSAVLLTQVQYIKKTPHKNFVICDSGMNHLMRPALYQAEHRILQAQKKNGSELLADVVGPVCESSDVMGKNRSFVGLSEGDWLAIADTGAYGASMMSDYNAFPRAEEIFI